MVCQVANAIRPTGKSSECVCALQRAVPFGENGMVSIIYAAKASIRHERGHGPICVRESGHPCLTEHVLKVAFHRFEMPDDDGFHFLAFWHRLGATFSCEAVTADGPPSEVQAVRDRQPKQPTGHYLQSASPKEPTPSAAFVRAIDADPSRSASVRARIASMVSGITMAWLSTM